MSGLKLKWSSERFLTKTMEHFAPNSFEVSAEAKSSSQETFRHLLDVGVLQIVRIGISMLNDDQWNKTIGSQSGINVGVGSRTNSSAPRSADSPKGRISPSISVVTAETTA